MSALGWTPVEEDTAPGRNGGRSVIGPRAHADVRASNMSLILRSLQSAPGLSRTGLVQRTGLSKATVSTLVAELVSRGVIVEEAPGASGSVGRPSTSLRLAPSAVSGVGVEIGPASLSVTVLDLGGGLARRRAVALPQAAAGPAATIEQVGRVVAAELGAQRARGARVPRVVLAQPGVIDYSSGRVLTSTPLGWHDVALAERVGAAVHRHLPEGGQVPRIVVENDAKLAALAAYGAYAQQGVSNLLYLSGGRGIGAGIIADGRLLRGWRGMTGEVGHMPVDPGGRRCRCGRRGCWETLVGLDAVTAVLPEGDPARDEDRPEAERTALLRRRLHPGAGPAGSTGPAGLEEHLVEVRRSLERGLAVLVDVLSPQVIVLSGWPAACAELILEPVCRFLEERRLDDRVRTRVEVSPLGEWAASHGAALVSI